MRDYDFHGYWLLPECDHPIDWMRLKAMQMAESVGKVKVKLEQGLRVCKFMVDDNELGVEDSAEPRI